jgi:CHAD domain-containing protein
MARTLAHPRFLVRRPLAALLRQWPLAAADDVEAIHQTRVATRRLREFVPILAGGPEGSGAPTLRRRLRDITRLYGPSRELDVSGMTLTAIERRSPVRAAAIASVRAHVERERAKAGRVRRQAARGVDLAGLAAWARELAGWADSPVATRTCAARAAARLDRRVHELQEALLGAGLIFAPAPLHRVRVALKKCRYALEVSARLGRFRLAGSMRRLKRMQDLLGDLHDLQVLAGHARDAAAADPASKRPPVEALISDIDDEIRALHARFVIERGGLVGVLARSTRVRDLLLELPAADEARTHTRRRRRGRRLQED